MVLYNFEPSNNICPLEKPDEKFLLKQIQDGNEQVFESVFKENYSRLCNLAYKYLQDSDVSEEIVQDVFFKLWEKRKELNIKTSIIGYLMISVKNRCLNQIKHFEVKEKYKSFHQEELSEEENNLPDHILVNELELKIISSIDLLPPERKKVFELSRFEGLKYKEIANKLSISVKTVENQMGKALQFLREQLKEYLVVTLLFLCSLAFYFING